MTWSLKQHLDRTDLRARAGTAAWERGQQYATAGRVVHPAADREQIIAQVQGEAVYEVRFWLRGNQLQYSCSCPAAAEGAFCKHCVAVGLVCAAAPAN